MLCHQNFKGRDLGRRALGHEVILPLDYKITWQIKIQIKIQIFILQVSTEAVAQRGSVKEVFLEISQNSPVPESFF